MDKGGLAIIDPHETVVKQKTQKRHSRMAKKHLIDATLAAGLCEDREEARRLILAGAVLVNGHRMSQPGAFVGGDVRLTLRDRPEWVSRAGQKLEYAVTRWRIPIEGLVTADAGAAGGGFTECLLRHGARRVYAIETGKGQLAWKLRQDPRVVVMEQTNILYLTTLPEPIDLMVVDTSWTPLRRSLPPAVRLLKAQGEVIALLKPNYEIQDTTRLTGGVLTDDRIRQEVVQDFLRWTEEQGWQARDAIPSPISGDKGNIEWLIWLTPAETRSL